MSPFAPKPLPVLDGPEFVVHVDACTSTHERCLQLVTRTGTEISRTELHLRGEDAVKLGEVLVARGRALVRP